MFADVAGSAHLFEHLGDAEAAYAVDRCLKRMDRAIEGFRGRRIQVAGDELLAVFESAEDACHAAVDMQQRIADLPPISGLKLAIRIGLHVGDVMDAGDELIGDTVTNAARIVGCARPNQILCSATLLAGLGENTSLKLRPMPELARLRQDDAEIALAQLDWQPPATVESTQPKPSGERLCLRYRGKAYLIDAQSPVLSLGRDPSSKILISDRKASRVHGRVEKRGDGYYFVDTSTNGSFVRFNGKQEIMVRRYEILLENRGSISFGSSLNDPNADFLEFEQL